jgi:DNA-binding PadR family transcriptional regulator
MSEQWQPEERLFLHRGNERDTSGSGRRYFTRGGVKYALLELLSHENMHGYQMMKALEEQSGGTYKPSAGSIYPTLQMLRDQGLVEPFKQDGKRVFQITEEGRSYLQEELSRAESSEAGASGEWETRDRVREGQDEEGESQEPGGVRRNRRLTPAGKELIHLLKAAERAALADAALATRLRETLAALRSELRGITGETDSGIVGAVVESVSDVAGRDPGEGAE